MRLRSRLSVAAFAPPASIQALPLLVLDSRIQNSRIAHVGLVVLTCAEQAHERLTAMNDPAKGGSKYLQERISNARDCLVEVQAPPPPPPEGGSQSGAGAKE